MKARFPLENINMKEAIRLWDDLGFYIWCCQWARANRVCEKLNIIKKEKPFIYYISWILSKAIIV